MDVDADRRAAHILIELGFAVARSGDEVHGSAPIVPEMWAPGTTACARRSWPRGSTTWPASPPSRCWRPGCRSPSSSTSTSTSRRRRAAPSTPSPAWSRPGRSVVVSEVDLTDDDGRPGGASAPRRSWSAPIPGLELPADIVARTVPRAPSGACAAPSPSAPAARRGEPGVAVLPRADDDLNAAGTVNGGLIALVVEEAALSLTPGATLSSMALRYLRPVRTGPGGGHRRGAGRARPGRGARRGRRRPARRRPPRRGPSTAQASALRRRRLRCLTSWSLRGET